MAFTVNVIHEFKKDGKNPISKIEDVLEKLLAVNETLIEQNSLLNSKINTIMANQASFDQALSRIDAATSKSAQGLTAVADRITALETTIAGLGLTDEQEQAILGSITGVADALEQQAASLEAMGKTAEEPVPVVVPEPVPADPATPIEPATPAAPVEEVVEEGTTEGEVEEGTTEEGEVEGGR